MPLSVGLSQCVAPALVLLTAVDERAPLDVGTDLVSQWGAVTFASYYGDGGAMLL